MQQRAGPVEHGVRGDPLAQRAHPAPLIVGRHQQRRVQRIGERIDRERIDVHGVLELARRAGEFREHQHAVLVGARGDELLGDQVHAVVQRRHHAHVGGAVDVRDLLGLVMLRPVDDRHPAVGAGTCALICVTQPSTSAHQRLVALQVLAARRADLHHRHALAPFGMALEHPLEGLQAIGNALGVVEAIDAEDDPLVRRGRAACATLPRSRRRARPALVGPVPQRRIDADRERPARRSARPPRHAAKCS